ncbi:MAG TPA: HD-GYP domain-containing protein [Firmicutes bacterium]|nr:HD-GYP domain-containing protein [Candidatus Fermentithermobacillaceae bacterium]
MRILPIHQVLPGMRLGRSVQDQEGRLIIAAGITLNRRLLSLLEEQGYTALHIADGFDDVDLPELVSLETKHEVMRSIRQFVEIEALHARRQTLSLLPGNFGLSPGINMISKARYEVCMNVMRAAEMLVGDIMSRKEVLIGMVDIKSLRDFSFGHSVQVALIALVIGRILGYNTKELRELGIGALLHDVGKTAVSTTLWMKPGELTREEFATVRDHPEAGFEILRKTSLGLMPAHVAYQHHERWDGSGYPRGLTGERISSYARVTAVCDVLDAMTSDRPYKAAMHPLEALSFIVENSGVLFDPRVVAAFSRVVAPFPVATGVILSTNETAVVKRLNPDSLERPVVTVTKDPDGHYYPHPRTIDLAAHPEIQIVSYAEWYTAPNLDEVLNMNRLVRGAMDRAVTGE